MGLSLGHLAAVLTLHGYDLTPCWAIFWHIIVRHLGVNLLSSPALELVPLRLAGAEQALLRDREATVDQDIVDGDIGADVPLFVDALAHTQHVLEDNVQHLMRDHAHDMVLVQAVNEGTVPENGPAICRHSRNLVSLDKVETGST